MATTGRWFWSIAIEDVVGKWTDITDLVDSGLLVIGLRADGTLYSSSSYSDCENWTGIRSIAAGVGGFFAISRNGTVLADEESPPGDYEYDSRIQYKVTEQDVERYTRYNRVRAWTDIRALYAGPNDVIGLKNDGTFVFTDSALEAYYRDLFV